MASRVLRKGRALLDTVVLLHAVFGLSATYAAAFLAARGWPGWAVVGWLTAALFFGRAAGFAFNRVIDWAIDARNPRTQGRPIPTGMLSPLETALFGVACLGLLALAAWELNPITLWFFPIAVAGLVVYPYGKRYTWTCHYWQVWPQICGPLGAWLAIRGNFAWPGVAFGLGYALWVAASDILYHAPDFSFHRASGLHSACADLGLARGFRLAAWTHGASAALFGWVGWRLGLHPAYAVALLAALGIALWQYRLVSPEALAGGARAFNTNAYVGPLLALGALLGSNWR